LLYQTITCTLPANSGRAQSPAKKQAGAYHGLAACRRGLGLVARISRRAGRIIRAGRAPNFFVVPSSLPVKNVAEYVALAKASRAR
jgi:hypothetical protein